MQMLTLVQSVATAIFFFVLLWVTVTVLLQDLKIIPALLLPKSPRPEKSEFIEHFFLSTDLGVSIEVWAYRDPELPNQKVMVCHHGNGHTVQNFLPYQKMLATLGFTVYQYDYRGVGNSSGWPDEKGIFKDALAVHHEAAKRENIAANQVAVMGVSLGTGPACYVAKEVNADFVLLYTPYTSFRQLVSQLASWVKVLAPLVWYRFTNLDHLVSWSNIKASTTKRLIIVHGKPDVVIPINHSLEISKKLSTAKNVKTDLLVNETAMHHLVIDDTFVELGKILN